jgi:ABC-type lipoprotein export system ATPase subunit
MLVSIDLKYQVPAGPSLSYPNLSIKSGESLLVLGKSGSGKTTLLHLLAGILPPTHGAITVNDTQLHTGTALQRHRFLGKHIGLVYQKSHFVESLTVQQNIELGPFFGQKKLDTQFLAQLVQALGIGALMKKKTYQISTGEAQRVAIARALVNKPSLVLADEPTSALDDHNCQQVAQLLMQQAQLANAMLVMVTHDSRLKPHFLHQMQLSQPSL